MRIKRDLDNAFDELFLHALKTKPLNGSRLRPFNTDTEYIVNETFPAGFPADSRS